MDLLNVVTFSASIRTFQSSTLENEIVQFYGPYLSILQCIDQNIVVFDILKMKFFVLFSASVLFSAPSFSTGCSFFSIDLKILCICTESRLFPSFFIQRSATKCRWGFNPVTKRIKQIETVGVSFCYHNIRQFFFSIVKIFLHLTR